MRNFFPHIPHPPLPEKKGLRILLGQAKTSIVKNVQKCCPYGTVGTPQRPDRLWGPSSLLYNGYQGLFQVAKVAGT
jgi:hypothetical protein